MSLKLLYYHLLTRPALLRQNGIQKYKSGVDFIILKTDKTIDKQQIK